MSLPTALLWVDPGKMTGLALYRKRGEPQFIAYEDSFIPAGSQIEYICMAYGQDLWIGWEKFHITPKTPPADAHSAIEMIGVARRAALLKRCLILPAAANSDRNPATRQMLQALGWWVPGKDDAQSAAQHLLAFMLRTGNVPDKEDTILARLRQGDDNGPH